MLADKSSDNLDLTQSKVALSTPSKAQSEVRTPTKELPDKIENYNIPYNTSIA